MITVIIPAYNEEGNIKILYEKLVAVLRNYSIYEIIFVDDGSSDSTLSKIKEMVYADESVKYISFSRNFGHQNALRAGLDHAHGDCVISMDADSQHPPDLIPNMVSKWQEGYDIVLTTRSDIGTKSFLKRWSSKLFYWFMNKLSGLNVESGAADFRLLDKRVVQIIRNVDETNLFLRGFVNWVGFKRCFLDYVPNQRFSGTTKYSYKKMISLAVQGITSFSVAPLHFLALFGLIISIFSGLYGLYALFMYFFTDTVTPGWTSVIASVLFIGGVQLIALGIVAEYVGKVFIEQKHRPNYIVKEKKL
jgi:dolichol-phosphate mannosyltransferase